MTIADESSAKRCRRLSRRLQNQHHSVSSPPPVAPHTRQHYSFQVFGRYFKQHETFLTFPRLVRSSARSRACRTSTAERQYRTTALPQFPPAVPTAVANPNDDELRPRHSDDGMRRQPKDHGIGTRAIPPVRPRRARAACFSSAIERVRERGVDAADVEHRLRP